MRPRAVTPPRPDLARVLFVLTAIAVVAIAAPSGVRADGAGHQASDDLADVGCPDPLVVHHPDGSIGATAAVAITSQALGRDAPGWTSVGWRAAPGTTLTAVLATTPSGVRTEPPAAAGTARGVLELAFCGIHDPGGTADGGDEAPGEPTAARTAPVRFDRPPEGTTPTPLAAVSGGAVGLAAGAVVLLMSRNARRDREATR